MTPEQIETFFARLQAANPEPETELEYHNAYTLLVAVVMSAQATDKGVNIATRKLFALADTPHKMVALGLDGIRDCIRTVGLYQTKSVNILSLSQALLDRFGGEVPADRESLESLAGVGRKTANVVLNVAFGQPTMAVDTHIFRVANRTGMGVGKNVRDVEERLVERVPPHYAVHAHHWLILHGRYVCKARQPLCESCCVADLCARNGL